MNTRKQNSLNNPVAQINKKKVHRISINKLKYIKEIEYQSICTYAQTDMRNDGFQLSTENKGKNRPAPMPNSTRSEEDCIQWTETNRGHKILINLTRH
jgi:hypothetical protein